MPFIHGLAPSTSALHCFTYCGHAAGDDHYLHSRKGKPNTRGSVPQAGPTNTGKGERRPQCAVVACCIWCSLQVCADSGVASWCVRTHQDTCMGCRCPPSSGSHSHKAGPSSGTPLQCPVTQLERSTYDVAAMEQCTLCGNSPLAVHARPKGRQPTLAGQPMCRTDCYYRQLITCRQPCKHAIW
jgi:hypothetical protein